MFEFFKPGFYARIEEPVNELDVFDSFQGPFRTRKEAYKKHPGRDIVFKLSDIDTNWVTCLIGALMIVLGTLVSLISSLVMVGRITINYFGLGWGIFIIVLVLILPVFPIIINFRKFGEALILLAVLCSAMYVLFTLAWNYSYYGFDLLNALYLSGFFFIFSGSQIRKIE